MDDYEFFKEKNSLTGFIDCIKRNSNCKIYCIFFEPKGGPLQCLWAKCFALSEKKTKNVSMEEILNYFKEKIEIKEKISGIEERKNELYINRPENYFNHEAMFIEFKCLYENNILRKDIKELFKIWNKIKPSGRIIIILNEM